MYAICACGEERWVACSRDASGVRNDNHPIICAIPPITIQDSKNVALVDGSIHSPEVGTLHIQQEVSTFVVYSLFLPIY